MKCFASLQLLSVDRCIIDWFKLKKKKGKKRNLKVLYASLPNSNINSNFLKNAPSYHYFICISHIYNLKSK